MWKKIKYISSVCRARKRRENHIENYYPKVGRKQTDSMNKSIAKFFAVSGVTFEVARNEEFVEMMRTINPAISHQTPPFVQKGTRRTRNQ